MKDSLCNAQVILFYVIDML